MMNKKEIALWRLTTHKHIFCLIYTYTIELNAKAGYASQLCYFTGHS